MNIAFLKYKNDKTKFELAKRIGFKVIETEDLEKTDEYIEKLVNARYKTIVISNEIASFSEKLMKKYQYSENVKIVIAPSNRNERL